MEVKLTFEPMEDENGYTTYSVKPLYNTTKQRNILLNNLEIREWSSLRDGTLCHYLKKDKPNKSVWLHTGNLTLFTSYEDCKQSLIKTIVIHLEQFASATIICK